MPHIHELIDYTAEVFIVHKDKVLIRKHDKYGMRTCPGGHIELDETPQEAAIREAKEETGLDITLYTKHQAFKWIYDNQTELIPPVYMNIHRIWESKHHHIGMIYFWYSETDIVIPIHESDASHNRRRMTLEEVQSAEEIAEPIKEYATQAILVFSHKN